MGELDIIIKALERSIQTLGPVQTGTHIPTGSSEAAVLGDLSAAGLYTGRFEFGAHDVGAPYIRRRVYLVAFASLSRLEVARAALPQAIERAKGAAASRGDWDPDSLPAFGMDAWRSEGVHERRERIEALGDSNPPAMAEAIMLAVGEALARRKTGRAPSSPQTAETRDVGPQPSSSQHHE